jgi:TonB family protein
MFDSWGDLGLHSVFKSPFLAPSLVLHLMALYLALGVGNFPAKESPAIPIQLLEMREGSSPDKSVGPSRGPGGPRTSPKLGNPAPPQQRTGKLDTGSLEATTPSQEPAPAPQPPALPGPKVLAGGAPPSPVSKETSSDSLVQLPTKESPANLPSTGNTEANQKSLTALRGGGDAAGIKALKEGPQLPGALKGTGTAPGPYGVPGGSSSGTGTTGGGTGVGSGGGSYAGLKGASNADFNQYLKLIEKRVNSVWRYPDDVSGVQKVTVRFILDRAGKLTQADVLESSDSRLNSSALEAMKKASPFPPMPEGLKELAGEPLIIRFTVSIRVRG